MHEDREPPEYPLRAPATSNDEEAPQASARTGPIFSLVGVLALVVLGGLVALVVVALVLAL